MLVRILFLILVVDSGINGSRLEDAIPGTPGEDYPVLNRIPRTQLSCAGRMDGYYADTQTRCQVFHICHDGRQSSFLCPNGTLFNQRFFVCDWWFNVDCSKAPALYSLNENLFRRQSQSQTLPLHSTAGFNSDQRLFQEQQHSSSSLFPGATSAPSFRSTSNDLARSSLQNFFQSSPPFGQSTVPARQVFTGPQSFRDPSMYSNPRPQQPNLAPATSSPWNSGPSTQSGIDEFDFSFLSPTPPPSFVAWKKEAPAFFQQQSQASNHRTPASSAYHVRHETYSQPWYFSSTPSGSDDRREFTTQSHRSSVSHPERLASTTLRTTTTTRRLTETTEPGSWVLLSQEPNMIANILSSSKVYLLQRQNSTRGVVETTKLPLPTTTVPRTTTTTTTTEQPSTTTRPTVETEDVEIVESVTVRLSPEKPEKQVVFTNNNIEVLNIHVAPVSEREIITAAPEGSNATSSPQFVQFSIGKPKAEFKPSVLLNPQGPKTVFQPTPPKTQLPPTVPVTPTNPTRAQPVTTVPQYTVQRPSVQPLVQVTNTARPVLYPVQVQTVLPRPVSPAHLLPQIPTAIPRPTLAAKPVFSVHPPVQTYQTSIPRPATTIGTVRTKASPVVWGTPYKPVPRPEPQVLALSPSSLIYFGAVHQVPSVRPQQVVTQLYPVQHQVTQAQHTRPPQPLQTRIPQQQVPQAQYVSQAQPLQTRVPHHQIPQVQYAAQVQPQQTRLPQGPHLQPGAFSPPQPMPLSRNAIPFKASPLISTTPAANSMTWQPVSASTHNPHRPVRAPLQSDIVYGTQTFSRKVPGLYPREFRVTGVSYR